MMPKAKPEEPFRERAREVFGFLVTDFAFKEERVPKDRNQFAIQLKKSTTRVVVESISWGCTTRVALGTAGDPGAFENYDLFDLVLATDPDDATVRRIIETSAQVDLPLLAELLKRYGDAVLRGDLSVFPQLRDIVTRRAAGLGVRYGPS